MGDQELKETLTSPVTTMRSGFISPCPRRHRSPNRSSNGNSYLTSANSCERGLTTHVAISLDICNMPFDALADFQDQLGLGHRFRRNLVSTGPNRFASGHTFTKSLIFPFDIQHDTIAN